MIGVILGFAAGTIFGVGLVCCLNVAKDADNETEKSERSRTAETE